MKVISIAGKMASGKTVTADLIVSSIHSKYGLGRKRVNVIGFSSVLKDLLLNPKAFGLCFKWSNKEFERDNLIAFGKRVEEECGRDYLYRIAIDIGRKNDLDYLILDGARKVEEFRDAGVRVYVDASDYVRFQRIIKRNSIKDKKITSLKEFVEKDIKECVNYRVQELMPYADVVIVNNYGNKQELAREVDELVNRLL